jgi:hypothetical protein
VEVLPWHLLPVGPLLLQLLRLKRKRRKKRFVFRLVVLSDPHSLLTQEESDDDMGFGLFD